MCNWATTAKGDSRGASGGEAGRFPHRNKGKCVGVSLENPTGHLRNNKAILNHYSDTQINKYNITNKKRQLPLMNASSECK